MINITAIEQELKEWQKELLKPATIERKLVIYDNIQSCKRIIDKFYKNL